MEFQALQAEVREGRGKGPARQLRMRGLIPAVFYGPGADPTTVAVSPKALRAALGTPMGRNAVIKLTIGTREELALVRDVQIDPVHREPEHADFYRVQLDRPVDVRVPFITTGKPIGLAKGGELHVVYRLLPVRALPEKIPVKIETDVSHLDMHDTVRVKELSLPEGVTVLLSQERTIASVLSEKKKEEEVAPVAAVAGAAAVPGAPAAPGAAPAPGAPAAAAAAAPAAKAEKGKK